MKYVMESIRGKAAKEILPVIRIEIDYQLVTLYDALQEDDLVEIFKAKERLEKLRLQLLGIENE